MNAARICCGYTHSDNKSNFECLLTYSGFLGLVFLIFYNNMRIICVIF